MPQSDTASLTGGLRRVLVGGVFMACTLAVVLVVAVSKLEREIAIWAWTSEINALRERLFTQSKDVLTGDSDLGLVDILDLFDELYLATQADFGRDDHSQLVVYLGELEARAREHFVNAEEGRSALASPRAALLQSVEALQGLSGNWATQIRSEEQRILRYSEEVDARSREIGELKSTLTSVLLSTQMLQQQVIAVERLIGTASEDIIRSSVAALNSASLPRPCAAGQEETGERICSPSVARVLSALERLQAGDAATIPQNVGFTIQGLQGYARAGQGRLDALTEEGVEVLGQMRDVRQRLAELRAMNSSLNRINRVLLDARATVGQPIWSITDLDNAHGRIRSISSQIGLRMSGLMRSNPFLEGDPALIVSRTEMIAGNWDTIHDIASARLASLDEFAETMGTLSSAIAGHAAKVRRDTELWVHLYTSSFLVLAAILVVLTAGLVVLARSRFVRPLIGVTGTIIRLARGDIERPVVLPQRAFGFDRLGNALEQLRLEMMERQLLAERNKEQQTIIASNLQELERTNQEMAWLAMHDPLTGLGNRRKADADLDALTNRDPQLRGDFCVMQIDIDRFKTINDALGHAAGDFILKSVSEILTTCFGADAQCYRTGGDEFLAVSLGDYSTEQAAHMALRLIKRIEAPIDFNGHRCNVGASIGIALGRDTDFDAVQSVINADLALYQVKHTGRGTFRFFTEELATLTSRKKDVSDRLIVALEQETFQPYYQPQFDARTRDLRGVEVLCRWHDETLGWISPGEFLPIAQELELIGKIDAVLFDKVAKDLVALSDMGLSIPRVSFNITADRLLKSGLAEELSAKIGPYTLITVELLESMSLDNPTESVRWAIDDLREHGIDIEIDDFGSDRASLAGLMAINPQAMKIDRSIVIPIVESARHLDLVKKIIDIGTALNIEVVAEGVETEEHTRRLGALGCHVLQGFGLAKPMPFNDLIALCDRKVGAAPNASNAVA